MCHKFNCCILFLAKNDELENESAINAFIITIYVSGFPAHYLFWKVDHIVEKIDFQQTPHLSLYITHTIFVVRFQPQFCR